ncbi:Uncharacterised protein [Enterobacter hormaechei]|nr:Uncharacterised protein [Enterobacter hormaechei]SAG16077.1 Uncharacterised protein [Enterobacter hormaechei]SAG92440.1 Uncharacterised protein [Enterobacter hormaechei]
MPVDGRCDAVYLRGRGLLVIGKRLVQAVDGCLVSVHVSLQTQQRTRRCLFLVDDHLINAIQLRAVTGDRCRQRFARGHLSQIALNNRDGGVLHSPRHAVHRHADVIDALAQRGIGRRHCLLKLAQRRRHISDRARQVCNAGLNLPDILGIFGNFLRLLRQFVVGLFDVVSHASNFFIAVHRVLDQVFERIGAFHVLQNGIGDIGYINAGLSAHKVCIP